MLKYLLAGIRAILVICYTAFQMLLLSIEGLFKGKSITLNFKHRRIWARNTMKILGIHLDLLKGEFKDNPALVISNHRTLLDPIIQLAYIDAFIIAKAEVGNLPVISSGAKMTGIIFVKREKLKSRLAAREKTKEILAAGNSVIVYAEGTTGVNRTTDKFKPGTFAIASELNIPVIPVAIEYPTKEDLWHDGSLGTQMVRQVGRWKTRVKMQIGDPIYASDAKELLQESQSAIDRNLGEMQLNWSEAFQ